MDKEKLIVINNKNKYQLISISTLQHIAGILGTNLIVPLTINSFAGYELYNNSMSLFCSGIGSIIFLLLTSFKVPLYLGSSTSYISVIALNDATWKSATFIAIFLTGFIYLFIGFIIFWTSIKWLKIFYSPIIIATSLIIIGMIACQSAFKNICLIKNPNTILHYPVWLGVFIGFLTFLVALIFMFKIKSYLNTIPCFLAVFFVTILCLVIDLIFKKQGVALISFEKITDFSSWEWYPNFKCFWKIDDQQIGPAVFAIVPITLVTIAKHIGDVENLSSILDENGKNKIYKKSFISNGASILMNSFASGPVCTTYLENINQNKNLNNYKIYGILFSSIIVIALSFFAPFTILISLVPLPVLGGVGILLFGLNIVNGFNILINNKIDLLEWKNFIIFWTMLITGLGVSFLTPTSSVMLFKNYQIFGSSIAIVLGILTQIITNLFSIFYKKMKK